MGRYSNPDNVTSSKASSLVTSPVAYPLELPDRSAKSNIASPLTKRTSNDGPPRHYETSTDGEPIRARCPGARTEHARWVSPKCLLETLGWRCGWSVASRGPGGVAHEVPAGPRFAGLAFVRRASCWDLAAVWLERGTR